MVWTGGGRYTLSKQDETELILLNHYYLRYLNKDHKKKLKYTFDKDVLKYIVHLALRYKVARTSVILFMMRKYLNDNRFQDWFERS
jgi:hypothetical protein